MSKKERNRQHYLEARKSTGCSQNEWARLFNLDSKAGAGCRQKGQPNVAAKEAGTKGVNMPECLASELLRHFHGLGYDVKNIEFNEEGKITNINKTSPSE
ncbi:hypothetical protein [Psychromonas sp. SP041]|uniref:hypothetical protein n=1 Tax=Psychromonas sp. SP041 TaxID=1365007 RepID=UPI000471BD49|nr:hypothetical protein [Psychromonas sp. SP041]